MFLNDNRTHSTDDLARQMTGIGRRFGHGARVIAIPATGTRGGNAQPIDVTVQTTRGEPDAYAVQILGVLADTPGTANVNSSAVRFTPQIDIEFNRDRARALDVNIGSAALAVRAAFGGTLATQFDTNNGTKYVQVLYPIADQTSLKTLRLDHAAYANRCDRAPRRHRHAGQNAPAQAADHAGESPDRDPPRRERRSPGYLLSNVQRDFLARVKALHLPNTVIVGAAAGGTQQNLLLTVQGLGWALLLSIHPRLSADGRALRCLSRAVRDHVRGAGRGDRRVRVPRDHATRA